MIRPAFVFAALLSAANVNSVSAIEGSGLLTKSSAWFGHGPIVRIDYPSGEETVIDGDASGYGPCFSPDGRKVCYANSGGIFIADRDGSNKTNQNLSVNVGNRPTLSWVTLADGEYLYWAEEHHGSPGVLLRAKVGSGQQVAVHTPSADVLHPSVSANGTRAAFTRSAYSVVGVDLTTGVERSFGSGCQGSISPSGKYVTRNHGDHRSASIHNWDGSVYSVITTPGGEFNKHRFSHSSDDYVVFDVAEAGITGYVCNIHTNEKWRVGSGNIFDFFPGSVSVKPTVANPSFSPEGGSFTESPVALTISCETEGATIRYTTDGAEPGEGSGTVVASGAPITLDIPTGGQITVKAVAMRDGFEPSSVVSATFLNLTLRDPDAPSVPLASGLDYVVYQGTGWDGLPDFSTLSPTDDGTTSSFDIGVAAVSDNFAVVFVGYFEAQQDGIYTFYLSSDDGSRLLIGDSIVVNNDGVHDIVERSGSIGLRGGRHALTLQYFDATMGQQLSVSYEGPGVAKGDIPAGLLYRAALDTPPYTVTSPVPGQTFVVGDVMSISWEHNPDVVRDASVYFSYDSMSTWVLLSKQGSIEPGTDRWDNFTWVIPETLMVDAATSVPLAGVTNGFVRVKQYMGDLFDVTDGPVAIVGASGASFSSRLQQRPGSVVLRAGRQGVFVQASAGHAVQLLSPSGTLVGCAVVTGTGCPVRLLPPAAGFYLVRVIGPDNASHVGSLLVP